MNIRSIRHWFRSLFLPSDRLFYLSVFRVLMGAIILSKILFLWPNIKFLFAADGLFEYPTDSDTVFELIPKSIFWDHLFLFYSFYICATVCMLFGIGRRWTIAAVWLATQISQHLNWVLCDGGDNLLTFSLLYLILANSFSHLCLKKTIRPQQEYSFSNFCTNVSVAAIIAHLCVVYVCSGLSKAHADVWYNGTAMYYILLGERFQGTKTWNELFANSALFNVVACYTTIIFESTFPFAVFVKRIRIPVLLMGISMHVGIYALMMIQSFQLIYIFHYGFFFTDDEWARFLANARSRLTLQPVHRFLANARSRLRLAPGPTIASTPLAEANYVPDGSRAYAESNTTMNVNSI